MRDLTKGTLRFIGEEEKNAVTLGGFKLGASRSQDRCSNHFATTTDFIEFTCLILRCLKWIRQLDQFTSKKQKGYSLTFELVKAECSNQKVVVGYV